MVMWNQEVHFLYGNVVANAWLLSPSMEPFEVSLTLPLWLLAAVASLAGRVRRQPILASSCGKTLCYLCFLTCDR